MKWKIKLNHQPDMFCFSNSARHDRPTVQVYEYHIPIGVHIGPSWPIRVHHGPSGPSPSTTPWSSWPDDRNPSSCCPAPCGNGPWYPWWNVVMVLCLWGTWWNLTRASDPFWDVAGNLFSLMNVNVWLWETWCHTLDLICVVKHAESQSQIGKIWQNHQISEQNAICSTLPWQ